MKRATLILFDNGDVGVPLDEQTLNYANVYAKKIELEQNRGLLIYVILHETFSFGEIFDFLFVSNYSDDWDISIESYDDCINKVLATYAWNVSAENRSDMGSILVLNIGDSLVRIS